MSGAGADVPVSKGECTRIMRLGKKQYIVTHQWAPHETEGLKITTKLMDQRHPSRVKSKNTAYTANDEDAFCLKAKEKAEEIFKGTRDKFEQAQERNGEQRDTAWRSADSSLGCPVRASLPQRTRTGGRRSPAPNLPTPEPPEQFDWRDTSPDFVKAMRAMTGDELLKCLADLKVPAAQELHEQQQEARELQAASRRALHDAAIAGRTNEGRRTYQTLLTAAAYDGDGPSTTSAKRKAEILGVHEHVLRAGRQRAIALQPELPPQQALDDGGYWYLPRAQRRKYEYNEEGEERGVESSEEKQEEEEGEEEKEEGPVSGVGKIRVEKAFTHHEVYASSASCYCSACRNRDYDKCYSNSMYPGLVPKLETHVVVQTAIMDTGVDPKFGVDPVRGGRKAKKLEFAKKETVRLMKRITGTQMGESFCDGS